MSKTKLIVSIIIVLIIIVGLYYILGNNNSAGNAANNAQTSPSTTNPVSNPPVVSNPLNTTPAPTSPTVSVKIKNFAFSPTKLSVKKGTKVIWTNNDTAPHTITSDSGSLLNSGTIAPGQSFSFTFTDSGSVNYHCSIHPMMKGSVVVE